MSKKALSDQRYELIKAHIIDPDNSPLPDHLQGHLDRVVGMAKILDKNPTTKHAVALQCSLFPEISKETAYRDARLARKLYNTNHEFDYDFWMTWLLNDIAENIRRCRKRDIPVNRKIIAQEHANLIKAIGQRPDEAADPLRNEKHQFYIMVNVHNKNVKIDINNLHKLPEDTLRELNKALMGGQEIDEQGAVQIMES